MIESSAILRVHGLFRLAAGGVSVCRTELPGLAFHKNVQEISAIRHIYDL